MAPPAAEAHRGQAAPARPWGLAGAPPWRTLAALALAVVLIHLWLAAAVLRDRLGAGAADTALARFEVAFVRELAPTEPPSVPPAPNAPQSIAAPPQPVPAASAAAGVGDDAPAPETAAAAPSEIDAEATAAAERADAAAGLLPDAGLEGVAAVPNADTSTAAGAQSAKAPTAAVATDLATAGAPPGAAAAASEAATTAPFEWPPSTRLSYRLTGNYRGPVEGQATVEWLRAGSRYQVHVELSIGPPFAPLMSRRASSQGEVTPEGLRPRRYDEETRLLLREPRRLVVFLDPDVVQLADGSRQPRPPGVQDSASQFVQLTWLFTTQPALLQPGVAIAFPLALPRRLHAWTYDVVAEEMLDTPAGTVRSFHVKPRAMPHPGGDLAAEFWVAPSLQYLPVRVLIRQDAQTWVDLLVERLPQQAEAGR